MSAEPMTQGEVLERWKDITSRQLRMIHAGIRLWQAVDAMDEVFKDDRVRDAAAGFRAVVEENV